MRQTGLLILAVFLAGCGSKKDPGSPPLEKDASAKAAYLQEAGLEKSSLSPYIRGKVAVLNRTEKGLERNVQDLLPPTLSAATRDDVETVVWLDWSSAAVPGVFYDLKGRKLPAVTWIVDVTVIDWKRKLFLGGPRFTGPPPKELFKSLPADAEGGVAGPRPYADIARYLIETARSVGVPK